MADFCKQCSIAMFGKDFEELAGASTAEDTANGLYTYQLCGTCGFVRVDHEGKCVDPECMEHG